MHQSISIDPIIVEIDELRTNIEGDAGRCIRCNRRIASGGKYHFRNGNIIGLECNKYVRIIESQGVDPSDVASVALSQYKAFMRERILASMKK